MTASQEVAASQEVIESWCGNRREPRSVRGPRSRSASQRAEIRVWYHRGSAPVSFSEKRWTSESGLAGNPRDRNRRVRRRPRRDPTGATISSRVGRYGPARIGRPPASSGYQANHRRGAGAVGAFFENALAPVVRGSLVGGAGDDRARREPRLVGNRRACRFASQGRTAGQPGLAVGILPSGLPR